MSNQTIPQRNLLRAAFRIALAQLGCALLCSVALFFAKGLPMAVSLFVGAASSVLPFLAFALILISAGFANRSKIAVRFFAGVFLKFILSSSMLWCAYFYIHLQLFALLSGFMLAYLILLCLPKRRWLQMQPVITNANSGASA